ncbi:hypothetical protein K502DRAFT_344876 [Neoconidiobolus thromboides FSU 785]|nr:hypothetical protein K502DRAFT_344876 [Neoconidiobolus thromboides FSU 785]
MSANPASQFLGIGLVLVLVQVSKRLNLEDPANLQYLRMAYATSQVIVFSLVYYIYTTINAKNDQTELRYEDKKPMSQEPPTEIVTTVQAYDLGELRKQLQSSAIGIAILMFMHLKLGYVQPLFLQSILSVKTLLESNLSKVHIFGSEPTGALKRPWVAASFFNMPSMDQSADEQPALQPSGVVELPSDEEVEVSNNSTSDKKNKTKKNKNTASSSS